MDANFLMGLDKEMIVILLFLLFRLIFKGLGESKAHVHTKI
jgi:hypothetical protein